MTAAGDHGAAEASALVQPTAAAFALGWEVGELYDGTFCQEQPGGPVPLRLPDRADLRPDQRIGLSLDRVKARLTRLSSEILEAGMKAPDVTALEECYTQAKRTPEDGHEAVYELHLEILQVLMATDFRLGTAYSLAVALAECCLRCDSPEEVRREFAHERLDSLRAGLNDLASTFPAHSAKAVLQSLTSWEAWVANLPRNEASLIAVSDAEMLTLRETMRRQGALWRAVLTGEKDARDLLTEDSYLEAGRVLILRTRELTRTIFRRLGALPLVIGAVVAIAGGLLISNNTTQFVTIIGSIAAALGVTWRSVTGALGKAAEKLEVPLWNAELDAAIATAITYLPAVGAPPPEMRILEESPLYLRVLRQVNDASSEDGAGQQELEQALGAWHYRDRRKWWRGDKHAVRASRLRGRAPNPEEVGYWLAWACAAGYVARSAAGRYRVTAEGERLAQIPGSQTGATRAALAAARPAIDEPELAPASASENGRDGKRSPADALSQSGG